MVDSRLGTLLKQLGFVKDEDLQRALDVSSQIRLPVGKILVMNESISDAVLRSVVETQWMVRDNLLTAKQAASAVSIAQRNSWTLPDALVVLGLDAFTTREARLGELLLNAKVIAEAELMLLLHVATTAGLPLGRVIMLLDKLPGDLVTAALALQQQIRQEKTEPQDAAAELQALDKQVQRLQTRDTKLGDLLVVAGIVSRADVDMAAGVAQAQAKLLGELVVEFGWVQAGVVEAAIRVQKLIRESQVSLNDAVSVLHDIGKNGKSVEGAIGDAKITPTELEKTISLYVFLRLTGYMSNARLQELIRDIVKNQQLSSYAVKKAGEIAGSRQTNLKEAIKTAVESTEVLAELLFKTDRGSSDLVQYALKVHEELAAGKIKLDYALVKFACYRTGCGVLCH